MAWLKPDTISAAAPVYCSLQTVAKKRVIEHKINALKARRAQAVRTGNHPDIKLVGNDPL